MATVNSKTSAKIDALLEDYVVSGGLSEDDQLYLLTKGGAHLTLGPIGDQLAFYNVKSHGATGNGSTDDLAAIHAARNAAGVGGTVYFPPGSYALSSDLFANVANQTWVISQGATLLHCGINAKYCIRITASHVRIVGPGLLSAPVMSDNGCIFIYDNLTDVQVRDLELSGGTYGVRVKGATGPVTDKVVIDSCRIHNGYTGVFLNAEAVDCQITNNYIYDTTSGNGIGAMLNSYRVHIEGNHLINLGRMGIEIHTGCHDSAIVNNLIYDVVDMGISVDNSDRTKVIGNTITSCGSYGIELASSNTCVVQGNTVKDSGDCGIICSGPDGTVDENSIANNNLLNPAMGGIAIGRSRWTRVIGNYILNAGAGQDHPAISQSYNTTASHVIISENIIRRTSVGSTAIALDGPGAIVSGNKIIHETSITTSYGVGINVPAEADNTVVTGNSILGNGKLAQGIVIGSGASGCIVMGNKIDGTTANMIKSYDATNTSNQVMGNVGTPTSGSGCDLGAALAIGNHVTGISQDYIILSGGTKIGMSTSEGLGFYGTEPIAKPTVSGAREFNPAVESLLSALASLGLIVNSTTS